MEVAVRHRLARLRRRFRLWQEPKFDRSECTTETRRQVRRISPSGPNELNELLQTAPFLAEANVSKLREIRQPPFGLCSKCSAAQLASNALNFIAAATSPKGSRAFARCAIVGSSASLLNASHGSLIDQHDFVLRFNDAPVTRWMPPLSRYAAEAGTPALAVHVGKRTTWRLTTPMAYQMLTIDLQANFTYGVSMADKAWRRRAAARRLIDIRNARMLAACSHILYCHNPSDHGAEHCHRRVAGAGAIVLNPSFVDATRRLVMKLAGSMPSRAYGVPSSGLIGAALGMATCDKVTLFGFEIQEDQAPSQNSGCSKYYPREWWDSARSGALRRAEWPTGMRCSATSKTYFDEGHWHSWSRERKTLRALAALGHLSICC